MRKQTLTSLVFSILAGTFAFLAFTSFQDSDQDTESKAEHEEDELHEHMELIEDATKRLRRSMRDPEQSAQTLELIAGMQRDTLICKSQLPPMIESLPEGERAAITTAFRRMMVDFLAAQLELEAAVLDGDAEKAKTAFAKVRDYEDTGHDRFTEEEED